LSWVFTLAALELGLVNLGSTRDRESVDAVAIIPVYIGGLVEVFIHSNR
jgi:hypothetical protein